MSGLVQVRRDRQRGCGWRNPGGLYLISAGVSSPCGKLPIPLDVCPTCHHGIKPTRSWTWIDGDAIAALKACVAPRECRMCPLGGVDIGRVGLLWIGEQFYPTPAHWIREAHAQGISRRLSAVPKGFVVGKTWVFVAHRLAISQSDGSFVPGIFQAFKPQALEYVVKGTETNDELEAMVKRGITPIQIERVEVERELELVQ